MTQQKPTVHTLKTWPALFEAVWEGRKPFEVRKNDRAFQTGDTVILVETRENGSSYVPAYARRIQARITFLLQGGQFGVEPTYCVLGLADFKKLDPVYESQSRG